MSTAERQTQIDATISPDRGEIPPTWAEQVYFDMVVTRLREAGLFDVGAGSPLEYRNQMRQMAVESHCCWATNWRNQIAFQPNLYNGEKILNSQGLIYAHPWLLPLRCHMLPPGTEKYVPNIQELNDSSEYALVNGINIGLMTNRGRGWYLFGLISVNGLPDGIEIVINQLAVQNYKSYEETIPKKWEWVQKSAPISVKSSCLFTEDSGDRVNLHWRSYTPYDDNKLLKKGGVEMEVRQMRYPPTETYPTFSFPKAVDDVVDWITSGGEGDLSVCGSNVFTVL